MQIFMSDRAKGFCQASGYIITWGLMTSGRGPQSNEVLIDLYQRSKIPVHTLTLLSKKKKKQKGKVSECSRLAPLLMTVIKLLGPGGAVTTYPSANADGSNPQPGREILQNN